MNAPAKSVNHINVREVNVNLNKILLQLYSHSI